jgi:uncharacterized protein (TIGR03437 family)
MLNGLPAPLLMISPDQINVQIPYETPAGSALVVVNNNGAVASYSFQVTAAAPGIFHNSGTVAAGTAARGGGVTLYVTGAGETTTMLDTGAAPPEDTPAGQLPKPLLPVQVTVGGVPAEVTFAGNSSMAGITQFVITVPPNAPTGAQPVVVTVGGVSSVGETLTVM